MVAVDFIMKKFILTICVIFISLPLYADELSIEKLSQLNLEELMSLDIIVTSAAKKPQKLANTASAIYVLTNNDIRRSGATTLPEVLRLVPGVQVARINAHKWAVSVRGFTSQYSSKLQVLIDGRSIYSHLTANVIWDISNPMLEDIERIEVIRGSGATLWGANAMNGVINIITKHSKDTKDNLLIAGAGNEEKHFAAARHGGEIADGSHYRFYIKSFEHDDGGSINGAQTNDLSRGFQGGFRSDLKVSNQDELTFQGDYFEGEEEENLTAVSLPKKSIDTKPVQYNLLGRWQHTGSQGNELTLQFYFNREQWDNDISSPALPDFNIDTYDIDFQHRFKAFERHDITWGLGYRLISDSYEDSTLVRYHPKHRIIPLYSGFIQNEIDLIPGFWHVIIGSKFEHNDYTGFEIQPTIRTLFNWDDQTLWAAISRSTRTPSRAEDNSSFTDGVAGAPLTINFINASNLKSEEMISYEIGYRFKFNKRLGFDLSAYYNDYGRLVDISSTNQNGSVITIDTSFTGDATVLGFEAAMDWRPIDSLTVKLSYSFLDDSSTVSDTSSNTEAAPHHLTTLFTSYDISRQWEFDFITRAVDQIDEYDIAAYIAIDTRLAFKPINGLELSVAAQNLFDSNHPEFGEKGIETTPTEIERSIYGKVSWQF
mgnify:CR=1 FL=1